MRLVWQDQSATSQAPKLKAEEMDGSSKHRKRYSVEDLWSESAQFIAGPRFLCSEISEDDSFYASMRHSQATSTSSSGSLEMAPPQERKYYNQNCTGNLEAPLLVSVYAGERDISDGSCSPCGTQCCVISDRRGKLGPTDSWLLEPKSVQVGPQFAKGMSGRLFRGLYMGESVAIKMLREPATADESVYLRRLFEEELYALKKLSHTNVIKLIGACEKGELRCIVTEYVPGGSLRDLLQNQRVPLPHSRVVQMALGIARGMAHVHSCGLIIRDLKSDNVLVGEDGTLKICDFGSSKSMEDSADMTGETGTYRWMAPEVMGAVGYNHKSDVYSFAIVLWELCTRRLPFEDLTPLQAAFAVCKKSARPPLPEGGHMPLIRLMQQCWQSNPKRRPEFSQIVWMLGNMK